MSNNATQKRCNQFNNACSCRFIGFLDMQSSLLGKRKGITTTIFAIVVIVVIVVAAGATYFQLFALQRQLARWFRLPLLRWFRLTPQRSCRLQSTTVISTVTTSRLTHIFWIKWELRNTTCEHHKGRRYDRKYDYADSGSGI